MGSHATDAVFQESTGAYAPGGRLDNLWPAALAAIALTAWRRTARPSPVRVGWSVGVLPLVAGVAAVAALVHAALADGSTATVVLAAAALLTGIVRAGLMMTENYALLRDARREALTDKLTELPNRRALVADLDAACASSRTTRAAHWRATCWWA